MLIRFDAKQTQRGYRRKKWLKSANLRKKSESRENRSREGANMERYTITVDQGGRWIIDDLDTGVSYFGEDADARLILLLLGSYDLLTRHDIRHTDEPHVTKTHDSVRV